jgi:hypothetical protein
MCIPSFCVETSELLKITVFWNVMPSSLIEQWSSAWGTQKRVTGYIKLKKKYSVINTE